MSETQTAPAAARKGRIRPQQLYVLRISLDDVRPEIWRTVRVPPDLTLGGLHWVIQFAMGWTNSHLHQFVVDGERFSDPRFELDEFEDDEVTIDEGSVTVGEALPHRKSRLQYEYDFGDSWDHTVRLEDAVDPVEGEPPFTCLAGERACPPEDCGGSGGYAEMLAALSDPDSPEAEVYHEWLGVRFNPEAFHLARTNRQLQGLRPVPRTLIDVKPPRKWDW